MEGQVYSWSYKNDALKRLPKKWRIVYWYKWQLSTIHRYSYKITSPYQHRKIGFEDEEMNDESLLQIVDMEKLHNFKSIPPSSSNLVRAWLTILFSKLEIVKLCFEGLKSNCRLHISQMTSPGGG